MKTGWIPGIAAVVFLAGGILTGMTVFDNGTQTPKKADTLGGIVVEAHAAEAVDYGRDYVPDIVTRNIYHDASVVEVTLSALKEEAAAGTVNAQKAAEDLLDVFSAFSGFSKYYEYGGEFSQEIDGVIYGAYVADGEDPIGGGIGYSEIFTTGDYVVSNLEELVSALEAAQSGEVVFIEGDADIDLTSVGVLVLGEGVTLASDRGAIRENGEVSTGARIWQAGYRSFRMISAGDRSRVTGLVLDGRNPHDHVLHHSRCFDGKNWADTQYYALTPTGNEGITAGNDMRVDNCEISGFGHGGIHLPVGVKGVRVDHCYIHHNQTNGLGYGIVHNNGTESVIEYCLFNYNRHSIAGTGAPVTGYIAHHNVELGETLSHCFDMHGGSDRGDGTDIAGTYCEMYNNTFLIKLEYPYWLRGVPEDYQTFYRNICLERYENYSEEHLINERATLYDNIFGGVLVK
ncbi:MAG: right-handed parallel beta-helix repeat-containing protein [Clostridia bacterium]|nr:right-handed parallel beta-helix repeat-containing protein [Clostridia bacterium]